MSGFGWLGALRQRRLSVLCLIACGAASVALAMPRGAEAAAWTLQGMPSPAAANGSLSAVSCATSSACQAVGYSLNGAGRQRMLVGGLSGTTWTVQSPTAPAGATMSVLESVSCTSTTTCMAVGGYATLGSEPNLPFAESLSGTTWSAQALPTPANSSLVNLTGVSCTASTSCFAVGNYMNSLTNHSEPFAAQWNGTSWAVRSVPLPSGTVATALYGVTCTSASACIATGGYSTTPTNSPALVLVETWNGTSWAVQSAPTPAGATAAALASVSCTAATACTAVGGYATSGSFPNKTLAERWDGSNWTIQTMPALAGTNVLTSVSCTGAECFAAGSPAERVALVEVWNGSNWAVQTSPKPSGAYYGGVSCTSTTTCTLVGARAPGNGPPQTLAEAGNGSSWTLQKTPNLGGAAASQLMGVSCAATSSCEAVGTYWPNGSHQNSLAEAWNGSKWAVQPTPIPGGATSVILNGVSCTSSTACEAVGQTEAGAFAEQLSGTTWSDQAPPNPASSFGAALSGVSCTSATSCVAVGGDYAIGSPSHHVPLAEQLSGSTWTVIAPATPVGETYGTLSAVTCTSSSACIAVGGYSTAANANPRNANQMLVEVWNGTTWTLQTPPIPAGATAATLSGVSCSDAIDCTAVGGYTTTVGGNLNKTLAERWDGSAWAVQTTPNPTSFSTFTADSCAVATACTALGNFFAEGWNGSVWSNQTLRQPPNQGSGQVTGVSCTAAALCTASLTNYQFYFQFAIFANSTFGGQMSLPLAERYS